MQSIMFTDDWPRDKVVTNRDSVCIQRSLVQTWIVSHEQEYGAKKSLLIELSNWRIDLVPWQNCTDCHCPPMCQRLS